MFFGRQIIALIFFGAMFCWRPAFADKAYDQCVDGVVELKEMNWQFQKCGIAYIERVDKQLNETWHGINAMLDESADDDMKRAKDMLLSEQRNWIKFQDSACQSLMLPSFGREAQVLSYYSCKGRGIEDRIKQLQAYCYTFNQEECGQFD